MISNQKLQVTILFFFHMIFSIRKSLELNQYKFLLLRQRKTLCKRKPGNQNNTLELFRTII